MSGGEWAAFRSGRYRLRPLARGGVADLAVGYAENGEVVTFKFLKRRLARFPALVGQLQLEYALLASGRPGLPRAVECGVHDGRPYIAYRYVAGMSVRRLLEALRRAGRPPSAATARRVLAGAARALHALHTGDPPAAHGDLSPENLLLGRGLEVVLVDLGCARRLDRPPDDAPLLAGKPRYLSPEQARGEPWGAASDIYQLGLVLYELVTGEPLIAPWLEHPSPAHAAAPSLAALAALPVPLRLLCRRMLEPDPAARPGAAAVLRALREP